MFFLSPSFVSPYVQKYVFICAYSFMDIATRLGMLQAYDAIKDADIFDEFSPNPSSTVWHANSFLRQRFQQKQGLICNRGGEWINILDPPIFFFFFFFLVPVIVQWIYQLPTLEKWTSFNMAIKRERDSAFRK